MAAAAHPDDIEFGMAGTLLLLKQAGAAIHMWNLADGACGTQRLPPTKIRALRKREAMASARLAGATLHPPIGKDLLLFFDASHLAKAAARLRAIQPDILLLPSPQDYMEDHQNAARLLAGAAFVRAMPNFKTSPASKPWSGDMTLYHAMPHGLRDALRKRLRPGQYVDIASVLAKKKEMLAAHRSQQEWLDSSQGMNATLREMEAMARDLGRLSGSFRFAEGWRRHNHLGYSSKDRDPLSEILGPLAHIDRAYEEDLHAPTP